MCKQRALGKSISTKVACIASAALLMVTGISQADNWTGAGPDNNWSTNGNWLDGSRPTPADSVIFDAVDSGGTNIVDTNFTITGLEYIGNGIHDTNLNGSSLLQIDGAASIGIGDGAMVTWSGVGSIGIGSAGSLQFWNVGLNNSGSGTNTSELTITDITVNAFVNELSIGRETGTATSSTSAADGSLTLGSNSTVTLGSVATPATLNIGWSQNTNSSGGALGSASGVLDALESNANLDFQLSELNVGRGTSRGVGTGTLRWNQTEVIHAADVYFGRGNATGILEVAAGGELHLGNSADTVTNLRIAHNDAGSGTATADLDFTVTNPTFTADIADDLSIGRETGTATSSTSAADGSLTLGSNSTVTLGSVATPATLNIGWSQNANSSGGALGSASGVLDTTEGAFTAELSTLTIGRTSNRGTASGEFIMGAGASVTANTVDVGMGAGASGRLSVLADVLTFTGADTALNFGTGVLEVPGGSFTVGSVVEPVSVVRIGYNNFTRGTASTAIDFTVTDPTFTAFIADDLSVGRETGTATSSTSAADGSLTLGSNSTVTLGSVATPATLNIGWSQNTNSSGGALGSASGVLDALESNANLDFQLSELNVGRGTSRGVGTGTLRWNQTEVIHAADVYFGRGNATGILEVAAGGELHLGNSADTVTNLRIAHNDAGSGTATADLDFTVTNPTFTADIADDLSIGRETGTATSSTSAADGSLTLGSNSTVTLGSVATPATLNIGWSQNANSSGGALGSASGVLDTTEGAFTAELSTLTIGRTSNRGTASGEFIMGAGASVTANTVDVGMGAGASGRLSVLADVLTFTGADTALNFGTGVLEVPGGSFTVGSVVEPVSVVRIGYNNFTRGTASTAIDFTVTDPTFTAFIADDLSVGRETGTATSSTSAADGSLTLGSNSTVTLGSVATPATLNIGWSQNTNSSGGALGSASGVLDALESNANLDFQLSELNVGRGTSRGVGTGTLRWNQTEVIHAADVYFGRGNATGILEVAAGGELHLGNSADTVTNLRIAHNDAGSGTATADLDFTVTNPTFTADIADDLSIGRETGTATSSTSAADGSLTLGSNSTVTLGSVATPATLNIGWSQNANSSGGALGSASGVLDTTEGAFTAELSTLTIGRTSNRGTASGEFIMGAGASVTANTVDVGMGAGASGRLSVLADVLTFTGADTALNFGTGVLEVPGGSFTVGSVVEPVSVVRIGYNNFTRGTASTAIDFTVTDPTFTAFIADDLSVGRETGTATSSTSAADGSLTLGSNSTVTLGSVATPATLNIGWSQNTNSSGGALGSASGVLDALESNANLDFQLSELNVGRGTSRGVGTGTLRWNQTEVIHAADVYFGRGNATGILEVAAGGELHLGNSADTVTNLRIAHNDAGSGTATADLDFTVTNPTFTADIADDLSIGRETGTATSSTSAADGSLTLGSNSTVTLGSVATPATLNIGWSQNANSSGGALGSASGVLDMSSGNVEAQLSVLNVGRTSGRGTASGTLTMGSSNQVTSTTVNIGTGTNAIGTVNLEDGQLVAQTINANGPDSTFNFTGGRLGLGGETLVTGSFNGTLDQEGGTLAPGFSRTDTSATGIAEINGDYNLFSAGTFEIELFGTTPGDLFDQVRVNGLVDLNGDSGTGGILDLNLGFAPNLGDGFTILENDGTDLIMTAFFGLEEGASLIEFFEGQTFTFGITYAGGTGNDIVLNVVSAVPIPPSVWLFGSGLLGLVGIARRKKV